MPESFEISEKTAEKLLKLATHANQSVDAYLESIMQAQSANNESAKDPPAQTGTSVTSNEDHILNRVVDHFFDYSADMLCIAGIDGYFKRVNPSFERILGYKPEELYAVPFLDFVHPDDREATLHALQTLEQGGDLERFENRYIRKDGKWVWISWMATRPDKYGFSYAVAREITDRKEHELQLVYDNSLIRHILSRITDGFCAFDRQGNISYINESARTLFGIEDQDDIIGKNARAVLPQFENQNFSTHITRAVDNHTAQSINIFEVKTQSWLEINIYPSDDGLTLYIQDVTKEYTSESQLRQSEAQFRGLFENALEGILIADDHGEIVEANPAAHVLYGYDSGTMNGRHLREIYAYNPEVSRNFQTIWQTFLENGSQQGEMVIKRPDGSERIVEFHSKAFITTNRHISILRDVTERNKALHDLEQSDERFRQLADSVNEVFWLGDVINEEILYINAAFEMIWGRPTPSPGPMLNISILDTVHPEDRSYMEAQLPNMLPLLRNGEEYISEYRIIRPDGDIRWVRSEFRPVRNADGAIYRFAGVTTDITATKIMEEALLDSVNLLEESVQRRTSELQQTNLELQAQIEARRTAQLERERLATILEMTSDFVAIFNTDLQMQYLNNAGRNMIGFEISDPIDTIRLYDLYPDWIHAIIRESLQQAQVEEIVSGEATLIAEDNTELPVSQVVISRKPDDEQPGYIAIICRDITEAKNTEDVLLQRIASEQELNELKSRFVSMLSHEFRTPLQAIMNSSDMVKNYADRISEERKAHYLTRIEKSVKHMDTLIKIIYTISRSESGEVKLDYKPEPLDIVQFCQEVIEEIRYAAKYSHEITFTFESCPPIPADVTLLYQAISNLLTNAMKYSPDGSDVYVDLKVNQTHVHISVSDHGIGIPKNYMPYLFEVFHRADNVGDVEGKGLGLAIVKYAIEAHSGTVDVQSQLNKGSTFTVTLPLSFDDYETQQFTSL